MPGGSLVSTSKHNQPDHHNIGLRRCKFIVNKEKRIPNDQKLLIIE